MHAGTILSMQMSNGNSIQFPMDFSKGKGNFLGGRGGLILLFKILYLHINLHFPVGF
jgi:hypothetical protein